MYAIASRYQTVHDVQIPLEGNLIKTNFERLENAGHDLKKLVELNLSLRFTISLFVQ